MKFRIRPEAADEGGNQLEKRRGSKTRKDRYARVSVQSKAEAPKDNPFETIWSRRKFDILGKKRKGEERRVGLARSKAVEKRQKTLLKQFEQSGKASLFVDKRIGEQNDALGEFDKAVLRSQRERRGKLSKKSKYNLSDGEENEIFLERDDFDEELAPDEFDDMDQSDDRKVSAILKSLEVGSSKETAEDEAAMGEETKSKSRKEVMEEIILKSKLFKAQKAKEKEENEELIEQLDKSFTSLVKSEALTSLTQPSKMHALTSLVNPSGSKEEKMKNALLIPEKSGASKQVQPDSYDKLLREMTMEVRARASDRIKTAEEIAEEEKERLEQLEQERERRMLDTHDGSDKDDEYAATDDEDIRSQKSRPISGDDLGDDFTYNDEKPGSARGWVDEILEGKSGDDSEDEDSDDAGSDDDDEEGTCEDSEEGTDEAHAKKVHAVKDWEQNDDDDLSSGFATLEEEEDVGMDSRCKGVKVKRCKLADNSQVKIKEAANHSDREKTRLEDKHSTLQQELPYVINAPSSMEELKSLFENRSSEEIIEAIRRIRACSAISIAAENRKKMQVFYGLLLQYFATLANTGALNLELLNLFVKPLMEISVEIPYFSAICARERILRTRMQLCEDIKDPEKSSWPSRKTLLLLRLWSMIFPCSDFRHAVITPALLLICEYLMRCPILAGRDAAVGSLLCSMVLSASKQSHKFCPEALTFLETLLMAALDRDFQSSLDSKGFDILELKAPRSLLCIQKCVDEISPLNFKTIMNSPDDSPYFSSDAFRASVLNSVVETIRGFVDIYRKLAAFPEIFLPLSTLLLKVADKPNMQGPLQDKLREVAALIKEKVDEHHLLRQPLKWGKKPPMVKFVAPKFEENYVKGRDYDPDRERAMQRKEKKLEKERAKNKVRELRKDNLIVAQLKAKEKTQLEEERALKYGQALAFLQEQEHAAKSGQLGKNRKRRR